MGGHALGERQRSPQYRAALKEWLAAIDVWDRAGEPSAGPLFARMWAAREAFLTQCQADSSDERLR